MQYNWQAEIDRHYAPGPLRDILMHHSRQVADLALELAHYHHLGLDDDEIEAAAMLHDIGIIGTDAPGIHCHGSAPYLQHGLIGAQMLAADGAPDFCVRVAQRHTGCGITNADIDAMHLPLPHGDYMPQTTLEQLVCYADKFYSKSGDMQRKSLDRVRASMLRHSPETLERFEVLHAKFGKP